MRFFKKLIKPSAAPPFIAAPLIKASAAPPFITALFTLLTAISLTACGKTADNTVVLRVANAEEYIDEGGWDDDEEIELSDGTTIFGENSLIEDFQAWYEKTYGEKVRVEYATYGTNEELYNLMSLGNTFDLVCPSEYMIMKLMEEGRLAPFSESFFDTSVKKNFYSRGVSPYIKDIFDKLEMNGEPISRYGAGFMWGTLGIVYNPELVDEKDTHHWSMLLDKKYEKQITMKDSIRDSYFIGLSILNQDRFPNKALEGSKEYEEQLEEAMNATDQATVDQVEEILSQMRLNSYSLETDSGKADLVSGKVVANMQWSGDAPYTMDQAEEDGLTLAYSVPEECSNLWFDAWCMMKDGLSEDSRKQQAAEAFVNFLSRPDNVVRDMYYIGYTSAISGGSSDLIYDYADYCFGAEDEDEAVEYDLSYFFGKGHVLLAEPEQLNRQLYGQYPPEEVLRRCAVMKCFDEEANKRISQMWINIRCFS